MIKGVHAMFYSNDPAATRAFLRDKLGLPSTDVGEGWLIFDFREADMGVHSTGPGSSPSGTHNVSFYTDDVAATVQELRAKGVELPDPEDRGYGLVTHFTMPGGIEVDLYQPKYK